MDNPLDAWVDNPLNLYEGGLVFEAHRLCTTQLKAQGLSRTCNTSKDEEKEEASRQNSMPSLGRRSPPVSTSAGRPVSVSAGRRALSPTPFRGLKFSVEGVEAGVWRLGFRA